MKLKECVDLIPLGKCYRVSFVCKISKNSTIRRAIEYRNTCWVKGDDEFELKFLLTCDVGEITTYECANESIVEFRLANIISYYIGVENA